VEHYSTGPCHVEICPILTIQPQRRRPVCVRLARTGR